MSRNTRRRKVSTRISAKPALDPVAELALSNGAKLDRGEFEVQAVPNPHGEVIRDGAPVRHFAVKRKPQYELLRSRQVISDKQAEVLEWYTVRHALADSGMIRNPLGNTGGGGAGAGIPISEARMGAIRDVDWARAAIYGEGGQLGGALLEIFDAVMSDEVSFVEAARRERAKRYVRISVRRRQDQMRDLFIEAAQRLLAAYVIRFPQGRGRIIKASW